MKKYEFNGVLSTLDAVNLKNKNIYKAMKIAVLSSGATVLKEDVVSFHKYHKYLLKIFPFFKHFDFIYNHGTTICFILSESHFNSHSYVEHNSCFFDIFTCGQTCKPELALHKLKELLGCEGKIKTVIRG